MLFFQKLKKIIKILLSSKIIFKKPKKTDLVVLDEQGADRLKLLTKNYNHYVLPIRYQSVNELNFSFVVINFLLKNLKKTRLSTAYFCSMIEALRPKLIITSIDNSLQVSNIAKILDKKFNFLAIQNAARYEFDEYGKNHASKFYIPELACFGNFEKYLYRKHNIKVKKFFVTGSINLSNYVNFIRANKKKNLIKKKYDICLISEPSTGWDKQFPGFEKSVAKIAEYTIKIAKKHNLKLAFVGKRPKYIIEKSIKKKNQAYVNEIDFYKKYLKGNYKIMKKNNKTFSSYQAMHNSKLTIGMMSTLLRENLALRGKVLSCNFTKNKIWNFPINGICSFNEISFDQFEQRVLKLLSISYRNYLSKLKKSPKYLIYFNKKKSTTDLLKKKINSYLS